MNKNNRIIFLFNLIMSIIMISYCYFYYNNIENLRWIIIGVIAIFFIIAKIHIKLNIIFFLIPYLYIFKFNPDTMSLVIVFEIFIIIQCIKDDGIRIKSLYNILILLGLQLLTVFFMNSNIITIIGFGINLLFLNLVCASKKCKGNYYRYIIGYIVAIIVGTISFIIMQPEYLETVQSAEVAIRFKGLLNDSNLYSQQILIGMCFCISCFIKFRKRILIIPYTTLLILGYLSYSKMFAITSIIVTIIGGYLVMKTGNKEDKIMNFIKKYIVIFIIVIVGIILTQKVLIPVFNERSIISGDITSGRLDLVMNYMKLMYYEPKYLLIGVGFDNSAYILYENIKVFLGSHNLYISIVFELGIIGSVLFVNIIYQSINTSNSYKFEINKSLFLFVLLISGLTLHIGTNDSVFILLALLSDNIQEINA